jgi:hypothetical protein
LLANSCLFTDRALTAAEIAALKGASAGGLALGTPEGPRLSVGRNGDSLTISWVNTNGGRRQRTGSLTNVDWQDVTIQPGTTSVTQSTSVTSAFYRWVQP